MKRSDDDGALVPAGPLTVTSQAPATWAGLTTVICVSELMTKSQTGVPPKSTSSTEEKPVPVRVTRVPPAVEPLVVPRAVTVGAEAVVTVKRSAEEAEEVPP